MPVQKVQSKYYETYQKVTSSASIGVLFEQITENICNKSFSVISKSYVIDLHITWMTLISMFTLQKHLFALQEKH